jgi:hypothetical protein
MVSCTLVVRQELGDWVVSVVLTEEYGEGFEPLKARAVYHYPLTASEWDADALGAVLSALHRWSVMTTQGDHARPV